MEWHEGAKVGAYRVLRLLGRGGMGEVYLASDERLGRQVAIKRVRPDRSADAGFRARFRREARLLARLGHPAIVQVFDLLEDPLGDGGDALVLEYVDGRSLAAIIAQGPLEAGSVLAYGEVIARGLAAAHERDLLHRDLKSGNVLVGQDGQVKILDFGLARPLADAGDSFAEAEGGEALTADAALLGTLATMSPEQARGERLEKSSDLFSLGVLLYEMARGSSPFRSSNPLETLRRVQELEPPSLLSLRPDLPGELCELIARLLAKDPAQRPGSAAEVAETLRRIAFDSKAGYSSYSPPALSDASTWLPSASDSAFSAKAAPARPKGEPALQGAAPSRRRRIVSLISAGFLLFVLGAGLATFLRPRATSESTLLRVAVPPPLSATTTSPLLLASVGIEVQRALLDLAGVVPFDSSQIGEISGGPLEAARAVDAEEVLSSRLFSEEGRILVVLQRLRARDGSVLWAENLEIASQQAGGGERALAADALLLSSAIRGALRRAYTGYATRQGRPEIEVSQSDYARFLEVRRRFDAGLRLVQPADLDELEAIGASSPNFADAHVWAAIVALGLHRDSKDPAYLARARQAIEHALPLGEDSPALLGAAIRLALAEGNDAEAGRLLERLERERPGDPSIVDLESRRLESQGRIDDAIELRRRALGHAATWRELYFLADLEYRRGESEAAREHLRAALDRAPGNAWALDKLGQIELAYGSLAEAERIFRALAEKEPRRGYFTNLGLAYFLAGRYDDAIAAYEKAAGLGGEHYALLLNLADAELARGRAAAAERLYGRALAQLEALQARAALAPKELTSKAQCLLHVGRREDAVALVLEALQKYPQETEVQYHAALVLAEAGERSSALACARRALELGFPRRWLEIPAFASLHEEAAFKVLLEPAAQAAAAQGGGSR